jgi:hypothetical protein
VKILFYAINHVGLGHVARLSVVQRFLTQRKLADCYFFSESRHAAEFFNCPGVLIDGEHANAKQRWRLLEAGVRRAVADVRPDILVCDTYWSEAIGSISGLMSRGGRAVLMLRMTDSRLMRLRLREALTVFDTILLPHHPREIRWAYRNDPHLLRQLDSPQVVPIGPVCRVSRALEVQGALRTKKEVIFSVGAGGEWPDASKANTIKTFMEAFAGASRLLTRHGHSKPTLAAGAFLRLTPDMRARFVVRRTASLHEHFSPRTTVVSRGGYNTTWEAVAARSRLVVCGTRNRLDDIKARSEFLMREGLGRSVTPDPRAIFKAIVDRWDAQETAVAQWAGLVNAGLPLAADEILGGAFLRAREPEREYPASNSAAIMTAKSKRLIARFQDVDALRPSPALIAAARLAIELGYDTRLCDGRAEDDDCVDVLIWPGPRVRNELRISEEIAEKRKNGVNTGLGIHADRMPLFLVEYLLRAFSLHNPRP